MHLVPSVCYLCVTAVAIAASEALKSGGRPHRRAPIPTAACAAGARGRRQRACGLLLPASEPTAPACAPGVWGCASVLLGSPPCVRRLGGEACARTHSVSAEVHIGQTSCWGSGARFCFRGSRGASGMLWPL
jgi:hypothetical protein